MVPLKGSLTCLASDAFRAFAEPLSSAGLLSERGLSLTSAVPSGLGSVQAAVALTRGVVDADHERFIAFAAERSLPVISVTESWLPGKWRLAEFFPAMGGNEDRRLARLVDTFGRHLDSDVVSALVSSMSSADIRIGRPVNGTGFEQTSDAFADLGLTHDAPESMGLLPAFRSLANGRLNSRDCTRRVLALEALFNTLSSDPSEIAAALDEAITAIARPVRRSVSIVITNFNYRYFVGAAIESAFVQTVPAREVIVVDDGSSDGSAELIAATPGIVSVLKENGGQASAFNIGFRHTSGDIVLFLDADDRLLPQAVERIGAAPLRGVSRLQFGLETIDCEGRHIGLYNGGAPAARGHLAGMLMTHGGFSFMPTSGNAFPREMLEALMPMPEKNWALCADLYLVLGSALVGETADLGMVLGQYRVHGRNGHFRLLGAEPYRQEERLARQTLAWKDLLPHLDRIMPPADADRFRLALQRRLLLTQSSGPPRRIRSLVSQALAVAACAARSRTVAPSQRLWHALLPFRLALGAGDLPSDSQSIKVAIGTEDLHGLAGPATWPLLALGARENLHSRVNGCEMAGRGWTSSAFDGLRMDAPQASLAFRLPELRAHWSLRVTFAVSGSEPLRHLLVSLNGVLIDRLELRGMGVFDLRLPLDLLRSWTSRGGPGARAACMVFDVSPRDVGRFAISSFELNLLPTMPTPAPRLPVACEVSLARGVTNAPPQSKEVDTLSVGSNVLADGWAWPDTSGVRLVGRARLSFSIADIGAHALTVGLTEDPCADLRDALQVVVNEALVEIYPAPDRRSFTFMLPEAAEGPGRVIVGLSVSRDSATGRWPILNLATLRLDRARYSDGTSVLLPNIEIDAGFFLEQDAKGSEGLATDESAARILGKKFSLTVPVAPGWTGAHLLLRVSAGTEWKEPVAASISVDGRPHKCWLGPDNLIELEVTDDVSPVLTLEGSLECSGPLFALHSLQLIRSSSAVALLGGFDQEPCVGNLNATALLSCADVPGDWHPVLEEALWLTRHSGSLRLPPMPKSTYALDVTVLTLDPPRQRMWLACGSERAETSGTGVQTLRIKVSNAVLTDLRLLVGCDAVVGASAVGAEGPRMLGGAICAIAAVCGSSDTPRCRGVEAYEGRVVESTSLRLSTENDIMQSSAMSATEEC